MLLDKLNEFADGASAITSGTTPLVLPNQIDLGVLGRDLGNGESIFICANAVTDIIGTTGAGSFTLQLVTDSAVNMTTAPVVLASSPVFVTNTTAQVGSKAGNILWQAALPQGIDYKRYIGVKVVPVTYAVSAGTVDVFLTQSPAANKHYADAAR